MEQKAGDAEKEESAEKVENLILTQEEVLKQNVLIAAGAQESNILLWDYDDYDGDGDCEAFMIVGNILDAGNGSVYKNESKWISDQESICFLSGLQFDGKYQCNMDCEGWKAGRRK